MESTIPSSQEHASLSSQPSVTYDPAAIPEATKDHDDVISEQFEDAQEGPAASTSIESNIAKSVALNADDANKFASVGNELPFYDASDNDDNKNDNENSSTSEVIITAEEASAKISNNERETDTETKTLLSSGSESSTNNGNGKEFDMLEDTENGNTKSDSSSASIAVISPSTDNGSNGKNSNNSSPEIIAFTPSYENNPNSNITTNTEALRVNTVKEQLDTKLILTDHTQVPSSELNLQVTSAVSPLGTSKSTVLNTPIAADFVQTITTNNKPQFYTVEATTSAAAEVPRGNIDGNVNKAASKSETSLGHSSSGEKRPGSLSSTDSSTPKAATSPKSTRIITIPPPPKSKSLVEKIKTNPKNTGAAITATALGLILIGSLIYAATHPTKTRGFFASVGNAGIILMEGLGQLVRNFFADPQFNKKLAIGSGVTLLVAGIFAAIIYALHNEGQKIQEMKSSIEPKNTFPSTVLDGANYCYSKSKSTLGF